VHIVDSMVNQHIKWLKTSRELPWRAPVASLNHLLTSHVWRQDHNGFSHQDPGFVDHVLNKSPEVVRVYLPPDANTLLSVADHALRSRDYVNVIVAAKQPCFDWLSIEQARAPCARGAGIWDWAGTENGGEPDAVLACAGDVPTQEVLAAAQLLRRHLPQLAVRVVNVVDMTRLLPREEHPHGMSDFEYDGLFTTDKPVICAYHGYPVADPPSRLPPHRAQEPARTRLQGVRHHHDTVRHGRPQRPRPLPPGHGCHRPRPRPRRPRRRRTPADGRRPHRHHAWIREHGTDLPEIADWSWNA
jgi:xylulose-5-phosphate/fructose-6-phosphate phosphoketolase